MYTQAHIFDNITYNVQVYTCTCTLCTLYMYYEKQPVLVLYVHCTCTVCTCVKQYQYIHVHVHVHVHCKCTMYIEFLLSMHVCTCIIIIHFVPAVINYFLIWLSEEGNEYFEGVHNMCTCTCSLSTACVVHMLRCTIYTVRTCTCTFVGVHAHCMMHISM